MKPRRWYSSAEMKPSSTLSTVLHYTSRIQLTYAARTYRQQGSIIKLMPVEPPHDSHGQDPQAPATNVIMRRIDAA
ncbi:MAG: hypothetical protein WCF99_14400 [Chloroflexales bacterium]